MVEKIIQSTSGKPMKKDGKSSFFLYVGSTIPNADQTIADVYEKYKADDGFLYIKYGEMEKF
jgi:hypothetical protein